MFNPESLKDGVAGEGILVKFHLSDFQTVFTTVLNLEISLPSFGGVMMDIFKINQSINVTNYVLSPQ